MVGVNGREQFERNYIPQVSRKAHLMHIFVGGRGSYIISPIKMAIIWVFLRL